MIFHVKNAQYNLIKSMINIFWLRTFTVWKTAAISVNCSFQHFCFVLKADLSWITSIRLQQYLQVGIFCYPTTDGLFLLLVSLGSGPPLAPNGWSGVRPSCLHRRCHTGLFRLQLICKWRTASVVIKFTFAKNAN